ncbi:MAG: hypothetical protein GY778_13485 [bacterium]|nr:hypothetical protein [bacterium]
MPRIQYIKKRFSDATQAIVDQANEIIKEYAGEGLSLTLRQLYYQFVARDLLANQQREYKRLGEIVNNGRLAGLIDWSAIVDRTRELRSVAHWGSPAEIVEACADQFRIDRWAQQENRLEVWIEKDALIGVLETVCRDNDVPCFSCRGYTSQSEVWTAAQRLLGWFRNGQEPVILHLGDHDPSGIDMTRDIRDRLELFCDRPIRVLRLALNREQVDEYNPPPNPAKLSDSRAAHYVAHHGDDSWELDALDPRTIRDLISTTIDRFRLPDEWERSLSIEEDGQGRLRAVCADL